MFVLVPRLVTEMPMSAGAKLLYGVLYCSMQDDDGAIDLTRDEIMAELGCLDGRQIQGWLRELKAADLVRLEEGSEGGQRKVRIIVRSCFGRDAS